MKYAKKLSTAKNLTELFEEMKSGLFDDELICRDSWENLPNFGGEYIENPECIWSWDTDNLIVGECGDDIEIVSRSEYFNS